MAHDPDEMLNLSDVGGRSEGMRYELYDQNNAKIGDIHPEVTATISNDTGGIIKRTMSGLQLIPSEYDDVNVLRDRVKPYWVLSDGTEYPMGYFLFVNSSSLRFSYGLHMKGSMCDFGLFLEQPTTTTISFAVGTRVVDAITTVLGLAGITNYQVPSTATTLSAPKVYPAGDSTTYGKILAELCVMGGFYDGYFNNSGKYIIRETVDPDANESSLHYLSGGRIIADGIVESNNLMEAPNRYIVLDSSITGTPVIGTYDIPDTAPHSYANRGIRIPRFLDIPGIGSSVNAITAARSAYLSDVKAFQTVTFASPPDPRHDTWDIIDYLGTNYLELGWSLRCEPGGEMTHTVRRVFL